MEGPNFAEGGPMVTRGGPVVTRGGPMVAKGRPMVAKGGPGVKMAHQKRWCAVSVTRRGVMRWGRICSATNFGGKARSLSRREPKKASFSSVV